MKNTKSNIKNPVNFKTKILIVNKRNKNHRIYSNHIIEPWIKEINNFTSLPIFSDASIESGIEMNIIGYVHKLKIKNNILECQAVLEESYVKENLKKHNKKSLRSYTIVPIGIASVIRQIVQKNYKLNGFQLTLKSESSFYETANSFGNSKDVSEIEKSETEIYLDEEREEIIANLIKGMKKK